MKFGGLISECTQLQLHFQQSLCNILIVIETFYFNDILQNWNRLLVEWRKCDHSIVVAAISQCRRRLSACVMSHSGHFEHTNFMVFSWFSMLS